MALITQEAMKYDKFREIIHTQEYSYPETNLVKEKRYFANHHGMLIGESRAYDGFIGARPDIRMKHGIPWYLQQNEMACS